MRTRTWLVRTLGFVGVTGLVLGAAVVDVVNYGPYATWYNRTLYDLSRAAGLDGDVDARVRRILGEPTRVTTTGAETRYYYAPLSFLRASEFEVLSERGTVVRFQMFDGTGFPLSRE